MFMKRIWALLVLFATCACGKGRDAWMEANGRPKVVATTSQIGYLVREIGGDRVDTWVLIRGGLDPHSYQLVKGDGERLDRADLVIANGLGLEHGASLAAWIEGSSKVLRVGEKLPSERLLDLQGRIDPHVWMDVSLWREGVAPIAEALSRVDPAGAPLYAERAQKMMRQLDALHGEIRAQMGALPSERRYLVTSHDAFHYFTRAYLADEGEATWRERATAPEGLAPEGQISPADLREVVTYLKQHPVGVIFPETNVSRDAISRIVLAGREEGLQVVVCEAPLYGDAMEEDYAASMRHNVDVMVRYLGAP